MSARFGNYTLEDAGHEDLRPKHDYWMLRYRITFPNGYGASVIKGSGSYGGERGLWELGVLFNGELVYPESIGDGDVIGFLEPDDVAAYLDQIAALGGDAA